jgi:hypothetical protein
MHDAVALRPLLSAPSPSGRFPYRIAELGGVRLII